MRGLSNIVGAVVATLVAGGCGKGTPERARAEKPEAVVVLAHRFMHDGDAEGLWALFSDAGQAQMELVLGGIASMPEEDLQREFGVRKADIDGLAGEALMARIMASPVGRTRARREESPAVTRVVPAGDDQATVEYTRGEATCSQRVIRVGGLWKMMDDGGKCSAPARPVDRGEHDARPATVVATPAPELAPELAPASAAPSAPAAAAAAPAVAPGAASAVPVPPTPVVEPSAPRPAAGGGPSKPATAVPVDNPYGR